MADYSDQGWRVPLTEKGFHGCKWNEVGKTRGEDAVAIRRLTKGVTATWY